MYRIGIKQDNGKWRYTWVSCENALLYNLQRIIKATNPAKISITREDENGYDEQENQ